MKAAVQDIIVVVVVVVVVIVVFEEYHQSDPSDTNASKAWLRRARNLAKQKN